MHWIAPAEKDAGTETLENRLWAAADQLRANSGLTSGQYSQPVLGLIFLRFAEVRFNKKRAALERLYEYFLAEFARDEGSRGGKFCTPTSIVRLLVEVLEPFHGRVFDPACGSGGMFGQSARFVAEHRKNPNAELAVHGQEKVAETVKLCRMNLAVHGLEGDIREGISYYDDLHNSTGALRLRTGESSVQRQRR
jgi:type I restriction enzyme M protein